MEIISAEAQISEMPNPEAGAVAVNKPSLAPNEALKLVFGEYAANTQRAYARAFRDLQVWADIRELREMEDFDPLRMLEYKNQLKASGKKSFNHQSNHECLTQSLQGADRVWLPQTKSFQSLRNPCGKS